jgi:methylmalonyl-CoA mutase N-terminal domain/subunit
MKEKFNAKKDDSCRLRFHTQTAGCTLTAQQPENNVVRVTMQALASVLGGTQSLHTNSMDEALSLPSQKAASLALRTQQIIAFESGVTHMVDPVGGSYFVETLTKRIEEEAQKYIDQIEENGGALWAVESGYFQKEIQKSAYDYQEKIEKNEKIVVGVNKFVEEEQNIKENIFRVNPEVQKEQIQKLQNIKNKRDKNKVKSNLNELKEKAQTDENLVYPVMNSVEAYATIGEICDVLREVWGEYKES